MTTPMFIDGSSIFELSADQIRLAKQGKVTAANHTVTWPEADWTLATSQMQESLDWIAANPDDLLLIRTVADLDEAYASGRVGVIFGPQDADFLENDLGKLHTAYDMGLRVMQLTYQNRNCVGDGCGVADAGPLTAFGREVVAAMNKLGILVDLSHVSIATGWSALEVSTKPIAYTHAVANEVTPHPRSKPDAQIKAVAAGGGVIGVPAASSLTQRTPRVQPTKDDFYAHVAYLVDLVGIDHVAIGLDFDQTNTEERYNAWHYAHPELDVDGFKFQFSDVHVQGYDDLSCWTQLHQDVLERGYTADEAAKITGGNWYRLFDQVWA